MCYNKSIRKSGAPISPHQPVSGLSEAQDNIITGGIYHEKICSSIRSGGSRSYAVRKRGHDKPFEGGSRDSERKFGDYGSLKTSVSCTQRCEDGAAYHPAYVTKARYHKFNIIKLIFHGLLS